MNLGMPLSLVRAREPPPAHVTLERLLAGVRAPMRSQVIAPAEAAIALRTVERLLAAVDAQMPGKLVRAREPLVTAGGWAAVRALLLGSGGAMLRSQPALWLLKLRTRPVCCAGPWLLLLLGELLQHQRLGRCRELS